MAGFIPYRSPEGHSAGAVKYYLVKNSATVTIGDAVNLDTGYVEPAALGERILGVVNGLAKQTTGGHYVPLGSDAAGSVSGTRSGNAGIYGSETYAAASDNTTVDKVVAQVIVDPDMEYMNDADEDLALGDEGKYYDNLAAGDQIDASSGSASTAAQWILTQRDPKNDADASWGVFRIAEHLYHR